MTFIRARLVAVALVSLSSMVQGCSVQADADTSTAMTQSQVQETILAYYGDILTLLPTGASFENLRPSQVFSSINCFESTDPDPDRLKTFGRAAWIRGLSESPEAVMPVVKKYWLDGGWEIQSEEAEVIRVARDGYSMSAALKPGPSIVLYSNSPCAVPEAEDYK